MFDFLLVGGLVAINFIFSQEYWEFLIIPIDELIFFRGVAQSPTRFDFLSKKAFAHTVIGIR